MTALEILDDLRAQASLEDSPAWWILYRITCRVEDVPAPVLINIEADAKAFNMLPAGNVDNFRKAMCYLEES